MSGKASSNGSRALLPKVDFEVGSDKKIKAEVISRKPDAQTTDQLDASQVTLPAQTALKGTKKTTKLSL